MGDLTENQASQSVKVIGSDLNGNESNYAAVDSSGNLKTTTSITNTAFTYANLITMANSLGFLDGESYDKIVFEVDQEIGFLIFSLANILQFELVIDITSEAQWQITKTESEGFLLQEDGFKLLQEDGFAIKTQGKLPV